MIAGAHEAAHLFVAKQTGDQLSLPLLFPSPLGTLGSFGGITRIKAPAANRCTLPLHNSRSCTSAIPQSFTTLASSVPYSILS